MKIKKSKDKDTPLAKDIIGISVGKIMAIHHALNEQKMHGTITTLGREVLKEIEEFLSEEGNGAG